MKRIFQFAVFFSTFLSVNFASAQNIAVNTSGTAAATANMFEVTQPAAAPTDYVSIFAKNLSTGTNAYAIWAEATGATNKYAIVVPSGGGYVGIGTSTPSRWLEVVGSGAGRHTASFLNTTGYGLALGSTSGSSFGSVGGSNQTQATSAADILRQRQQQAK